MAKRHLDNNGGFDDPPIYSGTLKPVTVKAKRNAVHSHPGGYTDYDIARLQAGILDERTFNSIGEKRRTGKSTFMNDVNKLSKIPNIAMGIATGLVGITSPAALGYVGDAFGLGLAAQDIKDKHYRQAVGNLLGVLGGNAIAHGLNYTKLGKTFQLRNQLIADRLLTSNKTLRNRLATENINHYRFKLGDVELGDPKTAYRQGNNIVNDFLKTNSVRTPDGDYGSKYIDTKLGRIHVPNQLNTTNAKAYIYIDGYGYKEILPNQRHKNIRLASVPRTKSKYNYTSFDNILKYNPDLDYDVIRELRALEEAGVKIDKTGPLKDLDPIFQLGLQTKAGKAAYPNGVDIFYRGVGNKRSLDDLLKLNNRYGSIFLGDEKMAMGYTGGLWSPGTKSFDEELQIARKNGLRKKSNLYQLVVPKGSYIDLGDLNGAYWKRLITPKNKNIVDRAKRLSDKYKTHMTLDNWINDRKTHDKYVDLIKKADEIAAHHQGISIQGKQYKFTDNIAKALKDRELIANGVLLRNIDDGPIGDELIWNVNSPIFPKSAIGSSLKFDMKDRTIKRYGGKLN